MSDKREDLGRLVKQMLGKSIISDGELRATIQSEMTSSVAVWTMSLAAYTFARQELGIQASESDRILLAKHLLRAFLNGLHKKMGAHFKSQLADFGVQDAIGSSVRFVTKQMAEGSIGMLDSQMEEIARVVKDARTRLEEQE